MTLEQYFYIGELAGAAALIISLVYVGVQVKLSTRATKAAAAQSYVDTNNGFVGLINQSPTLGEILFRGSQGLGNLDGGETVQFSAFHDQCFITMESNFYLWRDGLLADRLWSTHRHYLVGVLLMPGMQQWWRSRADWYSPDCREHVNRSVEEIGGKPMYSWATEA